MPEHTFAPPPAGPLAVRCGTLLTGPAAAVYDDVWLNIVDGTVHDIGPAPLTDPDTRIVEAPDAVVLPGLIDLHVHLITFAGRTTAQRLATPRSEEILLGAARARTLRDAGFTTVRDLGGSPAGLRDGIAKGYAAGPRIFSAVAALSQTGGHGDYRSRSGVETRPADPETPWIVVDGPQQVRRATRELLRAGADVIKIFASGGVMSDHDEPESPQFTTDEIAAAVYEAHAAGRPVAAHAISRQGIHHAVLAGVDTIEHGIYLDEETADLMRAHGTTLVPTLLAPIWIQRRAERDAGFAAPAMIEQAGRAAQRHRTAVELALAKGVTVAFGSDTGVVPAGAAAEELRLLHELGMPLETVIEAATQRAAAELHRHARRPLKLGTLAPGNVADFLVLHNCSQPGDLLGALAGAQFDVYQGGRLVRPGTSEV